MQIVVLPEVIEQKLKVEERKEVINFINALVADASDGLKKDIIEILEERFEKELSVGLVNLKLELSENITASENRLNERITAVEIKLSERITNVETGLSERITNVEAQLTKTEAQLNERISTSSEKLRVEIANSKAETIKWMFIFWMANVITIIGGIIGILKIAKVF
jgi:CII-binding regulator of phage lambda lysogenization HflD